MIEVVNRQRGRKIQTATWHSLANRILEVMGAPDSSVTIAFVSDNTIQKLNSRFRGINKATDVLSFPAEEPDNLGDIAISIETAARQAKENHLTIDGEIAQLILHGLLHLRGYDHETDNGEMNAVELKLRKKLGI